MSGKAAEAGLQNRLDQGKLGGPGPHVSGAALRRFCRLLRTAFSPLRPRKPKWHQVQSGVSTDLYFRATEL